MGRNRVHFLQSLDNCLQASLKSAGPAYGGFRWISGNVYVTGGHCQLFS